LISLNTGALTAQQVNWMLTHLPVDITYVDRDDAVWFFSAAKERIFPRSPVIIGRKVQQCHPPGFKAVLSFVSTSCALLLAIVTGV
jgi:DUF438 domain-containing protein